MVVLSISSHQDKSHAHHFGSEGTTTTTRPSQTRLFLNALAIRSPITHPTSYSIQEEEEEEEEYIGKSQSNERTATGCDGKGRWPTLQEDWKSLGKGEKNFPLAHLRSARQLSENIVHSTFQRGAGDDVGEQINQKPITTAMYRAL